MKDQISSRYSPWVLPAPKYLLCLIYLLCWCSTATTSVNRNSPNVHQSLTQTVTRSTTHIGLADLNVYKTVRPPPTPNEIQQVCNYTLSDCLIEENKQHPGYPFACRTSVDHDGSDTTLACSVCLVSKPPVRCGPCNQPIPGAGTDSTFWKICMANLITTPSPTTTRLPKIQPTEPQVNTATEPQANTGTETPGETRTDYKWTIAIWVSAAVVIAAVIALVVRRVRKNANRPIRDSGLPRDATVEELQQVLPPTGASSEQATNTDSAYNSATVSKSQSVTTLEFGSFDAENSAAKSHLLNKMSTSFQRQQYFN